MPRRLTLRSETLSELTTSDLLAVHGGQNTQTGCYSGVQNSCGTVCDLVHRVTTAQVGTLPTGLTEAC